MEQLEKWVAYCVSCAEKVKTKSEVRTFHDMAFGAVSYYEQTLVVKDDVDLFAIDEVHHLWGRLKDIFDDLINNTEG